MPLWTHHMLRRMAGAAWSGVGGCARVRPGGIPVLCYHSISDAPDAVSPARFAAHMRWLRRQGYRSASLDALLQPGEDAARRIVITFDDGLADLETNALPALLECAFTATVFFCPGLAGRTVWYSPRRRAVGPEPATDGKRLDFMSWEQAQRLAGAGVSFQSHTWSHARLSALEEQEMLAELAQARRALERRFGQPVRFLSYPFGDFDARVQAAAAKAGYAAAACTVPGVNRAPFDPFALRRIAAHPGDDRFAFACRLSPAAAWHYHRARPRGKAR